MDNWERNSNIELVHNTYGLVVAQGPLYVEARPTVEDRIAYNPLLGHLLDEDIEYDLRFCHPVISIPRAYERNTTGVSFMYGCLRVRLSYYPNVHIKLLV